MKYKDDLCNYQLHLFHQALEKYFENKEDEKTILSAKEKTYPFEFAPISKKELKCIKQLRECYDTYSEDGTTRMISNVPMPALIPTLTYCPHMTLDILLIMNSLSEYNINVVTGELIKR